MGILANEKQAVIIGSGPNGLAAAIVLAQAGVRTRVYEGRETLGGAAATAEATLPGFRHDLGASIFPMAKASPFFRSLPLEQFGLKWIEPGAPLAHPMDDGTAVMLEHDLLATAAGLGAEDSRTYLRVMKPLVEKWPELCGELLGPVLHWPRHPFLLARFGVLAGMPATWVGKTMFRGERARALLAGNAAHSVLPLEKLASAAVGLVLGAVGHAGGWPVAAGGAQAISDALAAYFRSLGGEIVTGHWVQSLREFGDVDAILCDVSPRQLKKMSSGVLDQKYERALECYRYGPGAFKVDWALSEPIPWRAEDCRRAGTVHLGGTMAEIAASERAPWEGAVHTRPFVLVAQPSLFDASRAPAGKHTTWGYCHVANGYVGSMLGAIEAQVERFAPGFKDCILARKVWGTADFEQWNPNLVGGDLSGGAMDLKQLIFRPTEWQYRTKVTGKTPVYVCSASSPPGGGVHGMCGFHAATAALRDWGITS